MPTAAVNSAPERSSPELCPAPVIPIHRILSRMMSVFFSPFLRTQEQVSPCSCVLCYAFSFQRRQNFIVRIAPAIATARCRPHLLRVQRLVPVAVLCAVRHEGCTARVTAGCIGSIRHLLILPFTKNYHFRLSPSLTLDFYHGILWIAPMFGFRL